MILFHVRCPEIAARETRGVEIPPGNPYLPPGRYGFVEHYCERGDCDCRRVLLMASEERKPARILATINYGWESPGFYEKWTGSRKDARDIVGACLDPLNPQSIHSDMLLGLFRFFVEKDPDWKRRFKRHYDLFKKAGPAESEKKR
jgi:hypothetical protein